MTGGEAVEKGKEDEMTRARLELMGIYIMNERHDRGGRGCGNRANGTQRQVDEGKRARARLERLGMGLGTWVNVI